MYNNLVHGASCMLPYSTIITFTVRATLGFVGVRVNHRIDLILCVVIFVLFALVLSLVSDMFFRIFELSILK